MSKTNNSQRSPLLAVAVVTALTLVSVLLYSALSNFPLRMPDWQFSLPRSESKINPSASFFAQGVLGSVINRTSDAGYGDTIKEVLADLRDEEFEVLVIFDQDGNKLIEHTDHNPRQVDLPIEASVALSRASDWIFVHNHPDDGRNSSFSLLDLKIAARHNVAETIIVSGDYVYRLKPGANGWPSEDVVSRYADELKALWNANEAGGDLFMREISTKEDGSLVTYLASTDALIKLFVHEFSLVYTIERAD